MLAALKLDELYVNSCVVPAKAETHTPCAIVYAMG